jgi:hypothetical protein
MSLIGLDLNASRARAVAGPRSHALALLALDADRADLPLALSLEGRAPQVGRPGLALTRLRPHLACTDFLPFVGAARTWSAGRLSLDAEAALAHVFAALKRPLACCTGMVMALPGYLDPLQVVHVHRVVESAGLRLLGSLPGPLAAALAVHEQERGWPAGPGLLLVVDADGHALTWSVVEHDSGHLALRLCQPSPALGRVHWLRKLLDGVARRCVRQSRRDPRDSAETEQALYEQIVLAMEANASPALVQLRIQGQQWYHHLMLAPDDLSAFVAPLLRQALAELESVLATVQMIGGLAGAVVTSSAASLPGLVPALQARLETMVQATPDEEADYGDMLLSAVNRHEPVRLLGPDALAMAAHEVAVRIHRGDVAPGPQEALPLPAPAEHEEIDLGPARVSFRGQEHLLTTAPFVLGRDPLCDLVFESELYPHVSARHCEIVYDRRTFILCDRSRYGTLLNDRKVEQQASLHSGDWIRLGPHGPVLRFLGRPAGSRG